MLVVNTSQPKRLYTAAQIVSAEWQSHTNPQWTTSTMGNWVDKTNKYIYLVAGMTSEPYLAIYRFTYDTAGNLTNRTPITLSGFWTFTGEPILTAIQWSHSGNFHLYCDNAWWSASFAVDQLYTVSISGTTATLGASLSVPSIASYAVNRVMCVGAVVYVFYRATANNVIDTGRKYSWGWSTLSGAALPSSVVSTVADNGSTTDVAEMYGWSSNKVRVPALGAWSSHDKFFNLFEDSISNQIFLKFDASTDTWSQAWFTYTQVIAEINWKVILHNNSSLVTYILNTSLAENGKLYWQNFGWLSSARFNWPIVDLENGMWLFRFNTSTFWFYWFFSGVAKRIGKISCSSLNGCWIIYQLNVSWLGNNTQ